MLGAQQLTQGMLSMLLLLPPPKNGHGHLAADLRLSHDAPPPYPPHPNGTHPSPDSDINSIELCASVPGLRRAARILTAADSRCAVDTAPPTPLPNNEHNHAVAASRLPSNVSPPSPNTDLHAHSPRTFYSKPSV